MMLWFSSTIFPHSCFLYALPIYLVILAQSFSLLSPSCSICLIFLSYTLSCWLSLSNCSLSFLDQEDIGWEWEHLLTEVSSELQTEWDQGERPDLYPMPVAWEATTLRPTPSRNGANHIIPTASDGIWAGAPKGSAELAHYFKNWINPSCKIIVWLVVYVGVVLWYIYLCIQIIY